MLPWSLHVISPSTPVSLPRVNVFSCHWGYVTILLVFLQWLCFLLVPFSPFLVIFVISVKELCQIVNDPRISVHTSEESTKYLIRLSLFTNRGLTVDSFLNSQEHGCFSFFSWACLYLQKRFFSSLHQREMETIKSSKEMKKHETWWTVSLCLSADMQKNTPVNLTVGQ